MLICRDLKDSTFVICNCFINKWAFPKAKVTSGKCRLEAMSRVTTQFKGPQSLFKTASQKLSCVTGREEETFYIR